MTDHDRTAVKRSNLTNQARTRWWSAIALVVVAASVRLGYLLYLEGTPGFLWIDADNYVGFAKMFWDADGHWRWSVDVLRYSGPYIKAPLYQLLLSVFSGSPLGYEWTAGLAHVALACATTVSLWWLIRQLQSERAALLGAGAYAVYFPSVVSTNVIGQERLYVPLLVFSFACVAWAVLGNGRWVRFFAAGVAMALAALTRSMPLYFAIPCALLIGVSAGEWRMGLRRGAAFLIGFFGVVIPYSVLLSSDLQQFVLIENIGTYGIARLNAQSRAQFPEGGSEAPALGQVVAHLQRQFAADPSGFAYEKFMVVIGNFRFGAGRWLDVQGILPNARSAGVAKFLGHTLGDLVFAVAALCAPLGVAVARQRVLAALLAGWVATHLVMTAVSGYAGQRFREPIDWALLALASCVVTGGWRRVTRTHILCAAPFVLAMAWAMILSLPDSIQSRADYGVRPWLYADASRTARVPGPAGFTVTAQGSIDVLVRTTSIDETRPVGISVDGVRIGVVSVDAEGYRLRVAHRQRRAFVELAPKESGSGDLEVIVRTRR